ncbi:UTP--glucose-1-phosphate uridylyltransferase GalU [Cohnella sp. REN36]|uniref:UTP--glucose-1-phosphate uridylyltransferase GalU n=1 Tax=Cohnella sp. REN36 TaxID=2887347 RepID=UPI001D150737|nr:UTP--glucose-1-phosphate uridylyltransferase GalU [Cohnella sp. REN36]MCC3376397.1 UTP--glucose-1-phosphate uridylyltransferase GalU [Cohnella sp. REN36]
MKTTIRKAVIPAAGLGTRFLPATKAQPKEMLPIVDKPAIQYIVEEAVQSGIESVIIVTGRNKKAIEDHFDKSVELEQSLLEKNRLDLLRELRAIEELANIHYIRQKEPLGLGHAVLCARQFIGDEPFAVLLGDDILASEPPALRQMIHAYEVHGRPLIGVRRIPPADTRKYGIVSASGWRDGIGRVEDLVEKPAPAEAPSNVAVIGRYLLPPSIFPVLAALERGAGGEYQLTDALRRICREEGLLALELAGDRYDIGDKFGYLQAIIDMGLRRPDLRQPLTDYMRKALAADTAGGGRIRRVAP